MVDDKFRQDAHRSASEAHYQERYNMYHSVESLETFDPVLKSRNRRKKLKAVEEHFQEHLVEDIKPKQAPMRDIRFLKDTAAIFMYIGDKEQDPIPYRGNVPLGVEYPQLVNYYAYGCESIDCRNLRKKTTKSSGTFKAV
jgi:hypothetical protein